MLQQTSPGFEAEQVFAAGVSLNMEEFRNLAKRRQFYQQLLERLANLPGVETAAAVSHLPFGGRTLQQNFILEVSEPVANQNRSLADYRVVTPTFFETLRIALKRGRLFTEQDKTNAPLVFIVNEAFVNAYLQGSDAIGERIKLGSEGQWTGEIVGVVGDVKHRTMEADAVPTIYVCYLQSEPLPSFPIMNYVVRAQAGSGLAVERVQRELQSAVGNQVVFYAKPMAEFIADSTAQRKFSMVLLSLFAVVALGLSAVGIYGLLSYQVSQRRREIAIRLALGARPEKVRGMVIWQGMRLAIGGLASGALCALGFVRLLQSLLYGISVTDAGTFFMVALVLVAIALLACIVPAHQAAKVDPAMVLRQE
jgi:putative ABC transport system permease protein